MITHKFPAALVPESRTIRIPDKRGLVESKLRLRKDSLYNFKQLGKFEKEWNVLPVHLVLSMVYTTKYLSDTM